MLVYKQRKQESDRLVLCIRRRHGAYENESESVHVVCCHLERSRILPEFLTTIFMTSRPLMALQQYIVEFDLFICPLIEKGEVLCAIPFIFHSNCGHSIVLSRFGHTLITRPVGRRVRKLARQ